MSSRLIVTLHYTSTVVCLTFINVLNGRETTNNMATTTLLEELFLVYVIEIFLMENLLNLNSTYFKTLTNRAAMIAHVNAFQKSVLANI